MRYNRIIESTISTVLAMALLSGCAISSIKSISKNKSESAESPISSFESVDVEVDMSTIDYVFPFLGEGSFTYQEPIHCGADFIEHSEFYGFCNSKGEIVIDPIYQYAYFNGYSYNVSRIDEDGNSYCGLISADGSKIVEYPGNYSFNVGDNYIFYDSELHKYVMYDCYLNQIYTSKEFSELVSGSNEDTLFHVIDNTYFIQTDEKLINIITGASYKINKNSYVVSGHNGSAYEINKSKGTINVYTDEGMIISGDYIDKKYSFNDEFILQKSENEFDVFDKSGNFIFTLNCVHCQGVGDRIYAFDDADNPTTVWVYDLNGNLIETKDASNLSAATVVFCDYFNNNYIYLSDYDNDLVVDKDLNIVYECSKGDYLVMDNYGEMYVFNFYNDQIYKVSTGEMIEVSNLCNNNSGTVEWVINDMVMFVSHEDGIAHSSLVNFENEVLFTNDCKLPEY